MGNRTTMMALAILLTATAAHAAETDIDYILETCYSCHRSGETGAIPALTGKPGILTVRALNDYRSGARKHPVMTTIANELDPNIIGMMAAFLAKAR